MSNAIVVGVTDAPVARRALDWAAERARALGEPLVLITVVGGAVGAVGEPEIVLRALAAAQALVDREVARVGEGLTVETRVEAGDPTEVLIEASAAASLLVIGSDYRGPGTHRGAHGTRIAAGAQSPVVVVPDVDLSGRAGIVVGVDGSQTAQLALEFAAGEARRSGDPLTAVAAWMPVPVLGTDPMGATTYPDPYLTDMQGFTEAMLDDALQSVRERYPDVTITPQVEVGDAATLIDRAAASARLAVVGTHGRGALARFLLGSVSHNVLAHVATVTAVVR